MYSQRGAIDLKRFFGLVQFLKDHAKPRQRAEMTRVLIVRLSAMGDLVQSLGAVRALHEAQPSLELHFVAARLMDLQSGFLLGAE